MKKYVQNIFSILTFFFVVTVPVAHAAPVVPRLFGTGGSGGCSNGGGLSNPLRNICSFEDFVELLLQAVISIGLPIAVLFIVYSGFLFVTAQGSETKIQKAKDVFFYTVIGVTIFLGSWALALIVKNTIGLITG